MTSKQHICPACHGSSLDEIYHLDAIPVQSCILLDSEKEARDFPRAPLTLLFCDDCGFVFNSVFDLALVDYASTTEESQHFSGTFNTFARTLAAEVAAHYDLNAKHTLEIGCGKGEFLLELAQRTGTVGLGVDPGFIPERLPDADGLQISFRNEYFDPNTIKVEPDLVVCRHTLEHIPDVSRFMADIRQVVGENRNAGLFFETPDVRRVLAEGAFWDIYYEHCSYFTLGSHARLFQKAGMDVGKLYLAYGDQYIIQYADMKPRTGGIQEANDLEAVRELAAHFPQRVSESRKYWTEFVQSRASNGQSVAIWGGGSKGVSFLTTNGLGDEVHQVIDINPHKQGKFLPGTSLRVSAPEDLMKAPPDTVIVMNPVYLPEISASLEKMGLTPELVGV
jgi:SAM-dependent methyltransferase